jgi:hypothetical protein
MPAKRKQDKDLIEERVRQLLKHFHNVEAVIFELALFVFLIGALAQVFTLQIHSLDLPPSFSGREFKSLLPVALTGAGGILILSVTISLFVYFLKGKTKKIKELEVRVVSAFMKALDESPLESHSLDNKHREHLNP